MRSAKLGKVPELATIFTGKIAIGEIATAMRPKERLLRRNIPKESIRTELEAWSDRLSIWEQFFTAMVVIGLVIEYCPEIGRFLPAWAFAEIKAQEHLLRDVGGLLVIVGVAGELWISFRGSKLETDLREETAVAISEVTMRAAEAEKAAAEANLARAKLEATVKRRTISRAFSEEEKIALVEVLRPFAGQTFTLRRSNLPINDLASREKAGVSVEQELFISALGNLLRTAGWVHENIANSPSRPVPQGLTLFIARGSDSFAAASALANGLSMLDISCQTSWSSEDGLPLVIGVGVL